MKFGCCFVLFFFLSFIKLILLYRAVNDSPLGISSVGIWFVVEWALCVLSVSFVVVNLFKSNLLTLLLCSTFSHSYRKMSRTHLYFAKHLCLIMHFSFICSSCDLCSLVWAKLKSVAHSKRLYEEKSRSFWLNITIISMNENIVFFFFKFWKHALHC